MNIQKKEKAIAFLLNTILLIGVIVSSYFSVVYTTRSPDDILLQIFTIIFCVAVFSFIIGFTLRKIQIRQLMSRWKATNILIFGIMSLVIAYLYYYDKTGWYIPQSGVSTGIAYGLFAYGTTLLGAGIIFSITSIKEKKQ
ncbi:MAG: hypothetical protein HZB92_01945 [Euryarchaeota archaeon]|nr:hypothetical protein [Euryarchaeota archaeon]